MMAHTLVALGLWLASMATPNFQAAGIVQSGVGPVTVPWPTHQVDDVGLLVVTTANEVVVAPAGWALVDAPQGVGSTGGSASTRLTVFWRRAVSALESDPVLSGSFNYILAQIVTVRGCQATGEPWNVVASDVRSQASNDVSVPGSATSVDGCLIVAIVTNAVDSPVDQTTGWANPTLTNVLERSDANTDQGNGGGFGIATGEKVFAGSYAPTTAMLLNSSAQGLMSIALRGDGGGSLIVPPVSLGRANLHTGFLGAFRVFGLHPTPLFIPVSNPHSFRDIAVIRSVCRMHALQMQHPIYAATLLLIRGSDGTIMGGAAIDADLIGAMTADSGPRLLSPLVDRETDVSPNYFRVPAGVPIFAVYQTYEPPTPKGMLSGAADLCEIDIIYAYALFRNDAAMNDVLEG